MGSSDVFKLQTDLNKLGEWELKNEMKVNRGNVKQEVLQNLGQRKNKVLIWMSINPKGN
jgi:hypothetical protein